MFKPELLSPAGSLDKLKVAVSYGADAVYLAGQKFGLRTAAENFTLDELDEGIEFAHSRGAKVFVVLNGFLHDAEIAELPTFVSQITELKADAVICSDLGVISTVAKTSKIPIHLSTQASCLNRYSAKMWKKMGVHRLILGREVLVEDAGRIKKETGLEVELFIHGSMCMAYSGNCTISNYTQGRDSNRGGCAQSCRFKYSLDYQDSKSAAHSHTVNNTAFMSSKDLNGLELLPVFIENEIDSLKIEGRMRSPLYAAVVSKVYREAIDTFSSKGFLPPENIEAWQAELKLLPNRTYTEASLIQPAGAQSVITHPDESSKSEVNYIGLVRKVVENKYTLVEVRAGFSKGDTIEIASRKGTSIEMSAQISNAIGEPLERAQPSSLVRLPYIDNIVAGQVVRKVK